MGEEQNGVEKQGNETALVPVAPPAPEEALVFRNGKLVSLEEAEKEKQRKRDKKQKPGKKHEECFMRSFCGTFGERRECGLCSQMGVCEVCSTCSLCGRSSGFCAKPAVAATPGMVGSGGSGRPEMSGLVPCPGG